MSFSQPQINYDEKSFESHEAVNEIMSLFSSSPLASIMNNSMKERLAIKTLENIVVNVIKTSMFVMGVDSEEKENEII